MSNGVSEAFYVIVKHERCNTMSLSIVHTRISVQTKVIIKELINAIPTTSAELSGPRD